MAEDSLQEFGKIQKTQPPCRRPEEGWDERFLRILRSKGRGKIEWKSQGWQKLETFLP
jgi:hypothetical protein